MSQLITKETAHRILFLVGFIFIGAGFVLDVGQPGDYWYAIFSETYQDFDIYYLPTPGGLYGITYGGEEPTLGGSGYLAFTGGSIDSILASAAFNVGASKIVGFGFNFGSTSSNSYCT